jgi:hypothetical protein
MNKFITILTMVIALSLSGCSSSSKKAGPLDGEWQGKGKNFTGKKFTRIMSWAPGQYVVMGTINDGDRESITKSLVVRKEAGGWVYETITTNKDKEVTGMQMRVKGMETAFTKNDASKIKVDWIKVLQKDGKVEKIEGDAMIFYNAILQSTWNSLLISGKSTPGGSLKVPAGTFAGTTKVHTVVKVLFMTVEGDSYMHPDVPINGVVKTVSDDVVTELIDFGFNGKAIIQ